MSSLVKSVVPPLISLVIVMLGNGFFTTFSSLRIAAENAPNWVIGLLSASYYTGLMMGSIYVERLINRIGHIRTFAIFASINSIVIVIQGMFIGPIAWTSLRFLTGLATAGFFIVIESWLLLSTGVKKRGRVLSFYMLTLYLAQGFGQFMLNIAPITSLIPFAITVVLSSLSVLPVSMMKSSGPIMMESSITNIIQIIKRAPLGPVGCFISGMIMGAFYGLAPIFGKEIGLSILKISQIMGFTILGGLLLQWPIGHLSDIFDRRKVLIGVGCVLMLITLALFKSGHFHYFALLGLMVLFGGVAFTVYPLSITLTCDHFSDKNIIGITCALLIIYGIGCIIGPLIAPIFMAFVGPSGLFLMMAILCACFISIGLLRIMSSKPIPDEEQSDYLPLPRATSLAFYLDPHTDAEDEGIYDENELFPFSEEYEDED